MRGVKQEITKLCFLRATNVHVGNSQSIVLYNEMFQRNSVERRGSLFLRKSRNQKYIHSLHVYFFMAVY